MGQIVFSELKLTAKQQMKGNVWLFFGTTLVLGLILSASGATVIGPLLLSGVIELGTVMLALEIARTGKTEFNTGFKGFSQFGSAFIAGLVGSIFIMLWSCLFIIPGIIAAFRYSMTFYILADNPEMSGMDALKKSKELMKGHKMEFFLLQLSFIGWGLLVPLTLGILSIWLIPYMETTNALYYEKIKGEISTDTDTAEETTEDTASTDEE